MLPARCAAANSRRIARVEHLRADRLQRQHVIERQRVQLARQRFVERRPLLAVQHGVVGEIRRRVGLIRGDRARRTPPCSSAAARSSSAAARRSSRRSPCSAPCRRASRRRGRDRRGWRPAASAAWSAASRTASRQGRWRTSRARPADPGRPDVADEQRVAGQHGVRFRSRSDRGRRRGSRSIRRCAPASRAPRAARGRARRVAVVERRERVLRPAPRRPDRWSRRCDRAARDGRRRNRRASA